MPEPRPNSLEPAAKRARTELQTPMQEKGSAKVWSWPKRVDELACGSYADCKAAVDDSLHLSWAQLSHRSKIVAKSLRDRGLTASPGSVYPRAAGEIIIAPSPIVLMMGHGVEGLVMNLGVLRQGFPVLPLSVQHADKKQLQKRYEEAMELFQPAAVIADSPDAAQALLNLRPGIRVFSTQELLQGADVEDYADVETTVDNALAYMFTSGSTGKSKCTTATNRMAWAEAQWYPELFHKLGVKIDPRKDRWRCDHEMGWWGAAYYGEIDVALAMAMCVVFMKPTDPNWAAKGITVTGALPSQLNNLWPGAKNIPETLRVVFCWAERCDVELGQLWKSKGVKMADLLIATEYFLTFASCNMEVARGSDGRAAHAMRPMSGAKVCLLDDKLHPIDESPDESPGLLAVGGPQVTPGYVELLDGTPAIGAGPLSQDMFKIVDGRWVAVPKDIMRRRPDHSYVSVGRAGGTVKVRGGVLMATNVVEQQLQHGSIAAACITDPVHVEGGGSLVLEMNWCDVWSMRDCLQRSAFLRLPVLFTCSMPRNASTGKVQKALVQEEVIQTAYAAETAALEALRRTQSAQLEWYLCLSRKALAVACCLQPKTLFGICWALGSLDSGHFFCCAAGFLPEAVFQVCLISWTYSTWAHVGKLGLSDAGLTILGLALLGVVIGYSWLALLTSSFLLLAVAAFGLFEKMSEEDGKQARSSMHFLFNRLSRLQFTYLVAFLSRSIPVDGMTSQFVLGLLCLIAVSRCLPAALPSTAVSQRFAAHFLSLIESLIFMLCWPVVFVLALPSLVLAQFQDLAFKQLKQQGQPLARDQQGKAYAGPGRELSQVKSETWRDGSVWLDVKTSYWEDSKEEQVMPKVQAATPAGILGQQLARQAGVDFRSVDSLKLARLSVLLKKHLKLAKQKEPLEFNELRDVCTDEQSFVSLIDERMELAEGMDVLPEKGARGSQSFLSWLQGGSVIHREGATQAPWDCQVDVLVEWHGPNPLDHATLCSAMTNVLQQHPMLRARFPPDDSTDLFAGGGRNGFSTTAAAIWSLITEVWSLQSSWTASYAQVIRCLVAKALWQCWPRTLIQDMDVISVDIPQFSKESDGKAANPADEVYDLLGETWDSWWKPSSAWNVCMLTLEQGSHSKQFLYCSVTHKYADGGAAAAFVHALRENYESILQGEATTTVHPVLELQQKRLWNFISGETCPEGSVDCYFFDIVNDMFYHDFGHSIGVFFTEQVCDTVRQAGLRMACSEEIAWLACITCALCRHLPNEKLIKILMVHNGRLGDAEGAVACVSQYVMLSIPCGDRSNTPLADVASRVKYAVTNGKFRRPATCEQSHAKINIGGMIGSDGHFTQAFKTGRGSKKSSWSRAPHVLQLRMDNEGGTWSVKDCKCHQILDPRVFWQTAICVAHEIKEGWFTNPLMS